MEKQKIGTILINCAKILLLVMTIIWLVFALLSGAESSGIFRNIPNALPWIVLLVFVLIAFRWQVAGGILIILFGIFTIIFFSAIEFIYILFIISLPIIILGFILTLAGSLLFKRLRK